MILAAAQGALSQARILGGSIGLATGTIILNNKLNNGLAGVLDAAQIKSLEQSLSTIGTLSATNRAIVANVFSDSFNKQMRVCTYLSVRAIISLVFP